MKAIKILKDIWSIKELRDKITLTFLLILIYRVGSYIVLPGINPAMLASNSGGLSALLDIFAGGAFSRASIMALGIMPYISASIIMQLLGIALPTIQKLQMEGESGRKKINQYTRILTILICFVQGPAYVSTFVSPQAIINETPFWWFVITILLISGTMFAMWLGEKITDKGLGNGISILIMVGIIAGLPGAFAQEATVRIQEGQTIFLIIELVLLLLVTIFAILMVQGTRRIPVQSAKRIVGARGARQMVAGGQRNFIPLKVNSSGVMPIIFAMAILQGLGFVIASINPQYSLDPFGFWYNLLTFVFIIIFTYFYTAIMINPQRIAEDLNRSGSFIPGVKPGQATANFIDTLLSRITLPGAILLALIAILPAFAVIGGIKQQFAYFYGGTSLLIMVGVMLDTLQQIETHLQSRHYDGLMKSGKIKGRVGNGMMAGSSAF